MYVESLDKILKRSWLCSRRSTYTYPVVQSGKCCNHQGPKIIEAGNLTDAARASAEAQIVINKDTLLKVKWRAADDASKPCHKSNSLFSDTEIVWFWNSLEESVYRQEILSSETE